MDVLQFQSLSISLLLKLIDTTCKRFHLMFLLHKMRDQVRFVNAVSKKHGWASLGVGDIIVDSAADESC